MSDLVDCVNHLTLSDADSANPNVPNASDGNKGDSKCSAGGNDNGCEVKFAEKRQSSKDQRRFSASSAILGGSIDVDIDLKPEPPTGLDGNGTAVGAPGVELGRIIGETKFTVGFALEALACRKDEWWDKLMAVSGLDGVERVDVEQISGIGYLSHIYRIRFHFYHSPSTPFSVILKVPTVVHIPTVNHLADDEFLRGFAHKLAERHDKEIICYENFGDAILRKDIVHLAKIYAARKCGGAEHLDDACILMEDLCGTTARHPSFFTGLNKEQVENLIRVIARIHALSLSIPNSKEVLEQLKFTSNLDQDDGSTKNAVVENLQKLPHDYFRTNRAALLNLAGKTDIMLFNVPERFGTPPVLCHGDFWVNNIFMRLDANKNISDEVYALLDWQFAHPDTGVNDLHRLLLCCVNASIKIRHLDSWLELYHSSFSAACSKFGVKCPYSLETVKEMFVVQYPSEMLFAYIIILNHYARAQDEAQRTALMGRMISSFEYIRKHFVE